MSRAKIDTLRGFACILLVAYHVVGDGASAGLKLADQSNWHYAVMSFDWLRMPLFTFISGIVYAAHRVRISELLVFAGKKLRRIALPFVVVATIYYLTQHYLLDGPAIGEMWRIYLFPFEHFWFLQALLVIFAVIALIDALWHPSEMILGLAVAPLTIAAHFFYDDVPGAFALTEALYLAPYFVFGIFIHGCYSAARTRAWIGVALLIAILGVALHQASLWGLLAPIPKNTVIATGCSLSLIFLLVAFAPSVRWLRMIGVFSYTIYLWHVFGTAGSRMMMEEAGIQNAAALFFVGLSAGLILPIVLHQAASVTPWLSWPLTGTASRRQNSLIFPIASPGVR